VSYSRLKDAKVVEMAYFANQIMRPLLGATFVRPVAVGIVDDEDFHRVKREVNERATFQVNNMS